MEGIQIKYKTWLKEGFHPRQPELTYVSIIWLGIWFVQFFRFSLLMSKDLCAL